MGSIYRPRVKDRSGFYRETRNFWIQYFVNGKRQRENARSADYEDAKRLLRIREGDVGTGRLTAGSIGITFRELLEDEIRDYRKNRYDSIGDLVIRIEKHIMPVFGDCRPSQVTPAEIDKYIVARQAEPGHRKGTLTANGTINRELAAIKRAFSLARENGKIAVEPVIKGLRENNARRGFFELEQFESVRWHLPEDLRPMATFAYVTGWRVRSEILPLQWPNVDFRAGVVRLDVGTTKNEEGREFPFTDQLRRLLEAQRAVADNLRREGIICPWVFHRHGQPIREFKRAWKTACRRAGVPGRIPHDFRRTAVRNLVRAGIPETVAMRMTGHKTRSVFDRYDITDTKDLVDAARLLDGHHSQNFQPNTSAAESIGPAK